MRTYECVYTLFYLVVVPCSWLLVSGPQSLKLGIQYVKQLLNQSHGRADISGLDPTPRVVHQLSCYVGSIFTALYLHTNTNAYMLTCSDGNSTTGWMLKLVGKLFTWKLKEIVSISPHKKTHACYLLSNQKKKKPLTAPLSSVLTQIALIEDIMSFLLSQVLFHLQITPLANTLQLQLIFAKRRRYNGFFQRCCFQTWGYFQGSCINFKNLLEIQSWARLAKESWFSPAEK